MEDLNGKVALVTGASSGIGEATARALASRGAAVMLAARRRDACARVAEAIRQDGGQADAVVCDVTRYADVEGAVANTVAAFGGLDVLINNAGTVEPIARLAESDPKAWADNVAVNLIGAYHAVRAALRQLHASGDGVIVNISSGAAHRPLEGWSAYCAAKAGLAMLTRAIGEEEGGQRVRVYGFAPGVVDTDMQVKIRASGVNPVSRLARSDLAPPEQPARVIAWLCTPAAADLAGQEFDIRTPDIRRRAGLD
jgi:3-oxoacyl-[acyl-carrier protein] reductase